MGRNVSKGMTLRRPHGSGAGQRTSWGNLQNFSTARFHRARARLPAGEAGASHPAGVLVAAQAFDIAFSRPHQDLHQAKEVTERQEPEYGPGDVTRESSSAPFRALQ